MNNSHTLTPIAPIGRGQLIGPSTAWMLREHAFKSNPNDSHVKNAHVTNPQTRMASCCSNMSQCVCVCVCVCVQGRRRDAQPLQLLFNAESGWCE